MPRRAGALALALALALPLGAGCAARRGRIPPDGGELTIPEPETAPRRPGAPVAPLAELAAIWRRMGLVVPRGDLPFVASVAYLAGRTPDSTLAVVTLSLPARALSFVREGDRYRAAYRVRLEVRGAGAAGAVVRLVDAEETVRVATFRETARTEESVLFAQTLALAPGSYALTLAVRDGEGSRTATAEGVALTVPRLGAGALATPVVTYEVRPRTRLDSLPRLLASPRAAAVLGQDSLLSVYVEGYGAADAPAAARLPLVALVRGERDAVLWRDTLSLARRDLGPAVADGASTGASTGASASAAAPGAPGARPAPGTRALYAGTVRVPVARLGIGVSTLQVTTAGASPAGTGTGTGTGAAARGDTARAPLFVTLGDELPVAGFEELLGYLRYYATAERLRALRDSSATARAAAWSTFLRDSDPVSTTTAHEGLREYFGRLRTANARFTDEGVAGWLTDRGAAYIALGEPDQILDPNAADASGRGRQQVWQYTEARVQLTFIDQSGAGRWRLTPTSNAEVQAAIRQRMVQ